MIVLRDDWQDADAWDHFVERHDQARFCHLFGYGSVVECYGYVPLYVCFLKDGAIVAVLPAVQVNSLLFERKLVSQPFSEYGGLLLDPTLVDDDIAEIFESLKTYVQTHRGIGSIEMHGNHGVPERWRTRWTVDSIPHYIAVLPLNRSVDELWRKVVRHSVRKAVNQARNYGLEVKSECNEEIIRKRFFPLYLKSMKRLGSPPHKIDYYLNCFAAFGDRMTIFWAMKRSAAVAGLLGFSCGSRVSIINTVSDPSEWHLRPNDLLHWQFVKWAAETNRKCFDFGSVRYEGQMIFKKKWGCELLEHKYYFVVGDDVKTRPRTLDSSSDSMHTMATLWSRYVPLSVGRILGPMVRKQLVR